MGFGQTGTKKCGGYLKFINQGWRCKSQKGDYFHKEGRFYVILLSCETLLQVLLSIYGKRFHRIGLFTTLALFCEFEAGKAKRATQSVLVVLTLNGLLEKFFQVFEFTLGNFRQKQSFTPRNCTQLCYTLQKL